MSRPESDMSELLAQRRVLDARLQATDKELKRIEEREVSIYQERTQQILEIHGAAHSKVLQDIRNEIVRYEQALATVNAQLVDAQRELRAYAAGRRPNDPGIAKRNEEIAILLSNQEGLGKIKEIYEKFLVDDQAKKLEDQKALASLNAAHSSNIVPPQFSSDDFDGASSFMNQYQAYLEDPSVQKLHPIVIAAMGGENFLSIVYCYLVNRQFNTAALYQAIYLATWFQNYTSIEAIIQQSHDYMDPDVMKSVLRLGKADSDRHKKHASYNQQNKTDQQSAAVAVMSTQLSSVIRDVIGEQHSSEHEHSSDEERTVGLGSHSPERHAAHEPSSPGSSESDPESTGSTPPKIAVMPDSPPKPLSEMAQGLIADFGVDKALSLAPRKIDLQKEICDQGLTFTYYDDENKNVFHRFVLSRKFEIAFYILTIYRGVVNSRNSDGRTALHLELFFDHTSFEETSLEIINFLLDHNADPTLKDRYGNTADYYADKKKFYKCAQYLRDKMIEYDRAHNQAPLLSQPAEISHASPVTPSRSLLPTPASVPTAVLTSNTSPALFRTQAPVVTAAASSKHSSPSAPINAQPPATGTNRGHVVSQPPVNTKANKEYKEKQGVISKLRKMLPGSSSNKSDVSRSFSPGVQP